MLKLSKIILLFILITSPALEANTPDLYDKINEAQNNGETSWPGLHWAIDMMQDEELALVMLDMFPEQIWKLTGAEALKTDGPKKFDYGFSPLDLAIKNGFLKLGKALFDRGANPNQRHKIRWHISDFHGSDKYPLAYAIELQNKEFISLLLEAGASTESVYLHSTVYNTQGVNHSAIMHALEYFPDDEVLRMIITNNMKTKGKPVQDITDEDLELVKKYTTDPTLTSGPWPALHHAFYMRDHVAAKRLFDLGAHTDPYYYAQYLASNAVGKAIFSSKDRPKPLVDMAIEYDDHDLLLLLLDENIESEKILNYALETNQIDLLEKAISLNVPSNDAVHKAVVDKKIDILLALLTNGYPISEASVFYTFEHDDVESLKILLDHGAVIPEKAPFSPTLGMPETMGSLYLMDKLAIFEYFIDQGHSFKASTFAFTAIQQNRLPFLQIIVEKIGLSASELNAAIQHAIKVNNQPAYEYLRSIDP